MKSFCRLALPGLVLLMLFTLSACGTAENGTETPLDTPAAEAPAEPETLVFSDGSYRRSEAYMTAFSTKYVELDSLTVHIAAPIFDETAALDWMQQIAADFDAAQAFGGQLVRPVTVYVVEESYTGMPVVSENTLFCAMADVESGAYRPFLTQACFGLRNLWQCYGLSQTIFGNETADLAALLEQGASTDALSLFPACFLPSFSDEATIETARAAAYALTGYMLEQDSLEAYLSGDWIASQRAWLTSLGLPADFTEAASYREAAGMEWAFSEDYPLVMTAETIRFYLKPTDWLTGPEAVQDYLVTFFTGYDGMMEYLQEQAPDYMAQYLADGPIVSVYLASSDELTASNASFPSRDAYVNNPNSSWHEVLHCIAGQSDAASPESTWLCEGFATLIEGPYCTDFSVVPNREKEILFQFLTVVPFSPKAPKIQQRFQESLVRLYEQETYLPETVHDVDLAAFDRACGRISMLEPELTALAAASAASNPETSIVPTSVIATVASRKSNFTAKNYSVYPGNRLTYVEAMLFTEYLIDQNGMEAVIAAISNSTAYQELVPDFESDYAAFLEWYREQEA